MYNLPSEYSFRIVDINAKLSKYSNYYQVFTNTIVIISFKVLLHFSKAYTGTKCKTVQWCCCYVWTFLRTVAVFTIDSDDTGTNIIYINTYSIFITVTDTYKLNKILLSGSSKRLLRKASTNLVDNSCSCICSERPCRKTLNSL